jgi:hypothetical protein
LSAAPFPNVNSPQKFNAKGARGARVANACDFAPLATLAFFLFLFSFYFESKGDNPQQRFARRERILPAGEKSAKIPGQRLLKNQNLC